MRISDWSSDVCSSDLAARIEALTAFPVDVVTCRAFAPLPQILDLTERFLLASNRGIQPVGLFLKGRRADEELTAAAKKWRLRLERFASETDPEARSEEHTSELQSLMRTSYAVF